MAIKYNPLDPFGTNSLFANINKTNQQVNSMNLPMQPTQPKQDFKRQRYGNMMLALSDVLRGQNPSVGVMQRQALIDAERKEAERKADIEAFLENNPQYRQAYKLKNLLGISAPDRKIVEGVDGIKYYTDGTRVLPNVTAPPKAEDIYSAEAARIKSIVLNEGLNSPNLTDPQREFYNTYIKPTGGNWLNQYMSGNLGTNTPETKTSYSVINNDYGSSSAESIISSTMELNPGLSREDVIQNLIANNIIKAE